MEKKLEGLIWFICAGDEYLTIQKTDSDLALRERYTVNDMIRLYESMEIQ